VSESLRKFISLKCSLESNSPDNSLPAYLSHTWDLSIRLAIYKREVAKVNKMRTTIDVEVSGYFHIAAALPPRKEHTIRIG
jgi:hypothetical protein